MNCLTLGQGPSAPKRLAFDKKKESVLLQRGWERCPQCSRLTAHSEEVQAQPGWLRLTAAKYAPSKYRQSSSGTRTSLGVHPAGVWRRAHRPPGAPQPQRRPCRRFSAAARPQRPCKRAYKRFVEGWADSLPHVADWAGCQRRGRSLSSKACCRPWAS